MKPKRITEIPIPAWQVDLLDTAHWARERAWAIAQSAATGRDLLLDMRLPCKCSPTGDGGWFTCERCRLATLLLEMEQT